MGSGASATVPETPGGDLRLPTSGLRFSVNQLRALNSYVDTLWEEDQRGRMSTELESTIESLVQRIVDGAGQRDPRFRCCHLIALHRGKKMKSRSLEYLVTLDALPILNAGDDSKLVDGPVGYGKIRLTGRDADLWEDFLSPQGYLCRDKVLERWVDLIARCAGARSSAGGARVLTAQAHAAAQPYTYCYLERATAAPQSSIDRRLAIVEGSAWVMVRVGNAEAKLMLGARVRGCPPNTLRVPASHPLAMLHYKAVQQGYYAVAVGPPSSMVCGDRGSNWQLWNPAFEAALDAHFSDVSTVAKVAGAVNALVDNMREGAYQGSLLAVSRYLCWCLWRRRLDRCPQLGTAAARAFVSAHASHHLLLILDSLLAVCLGECKAGYWVGVGRESLCRRGARAQRWEADAACVRTCLMHLSRTQGEEIPPTPAECLESAMFSRWESINKEARASAGNTYSRRQLRYLFTLFMELLNCHNSVNSESHSTFHANLIQATSMHQEPVEDLIHILAIILDQARDLYINNFHSSWSHVDRDISNYRSKKWSKLKDYYDASSTCLIDAVRRDPALMTADFSDHHQMMKTLFHWLNKATKEDKKYLGPVLKPYLEQLFMSSLENCWYDHEGEKELDGLKEYCLGVHEGNDPCRGLLQAAKKHAWAKLMVDFVDRFKHIEFRLVFPTGEGMGMSVSVAFVSSGDARTVTLSRADKQHAKLRLATRALRTAFAATLTSNTSQKPRTLLRHESEDILASVKSGSYYSSTKPDIIPSTSQDLDVPRLRRRSRRSRPATAYGFPEISITSQSDPKTIRRKYHTLKSLVYKEPVDVKEIRQRPRSAGSTVKNKEAMSRPSILETMDFINSVRDALSVEESGASDVEESPWSVNEEWWLGVVAPLNVVTSHRGAAALHHVPGDLVLAMVNRGKFTVLQEVCAWVVSGREGALFALHRLARAARSRSSERRTSSWKLPEPTVAPPQWYRSRPPDYMSGDEAPPPPPPPLPRTGRGTPVLPAYTDYLPPRRIPETYDPKPPSYTGIINPIYDIKLPKDKFQVKRSRSLGRSFSTKSLGIEITKYNLTLGHRSGKKTNDVVTAISGMTGETGLEPKSNFFQRRATQDVVGDSYRVSRVTID